MKKSISIILLIITILLIDFYWIFLDYWWHWFFITGFALLGWGWMRK